MARLVTATASSVLTSSVLYLLANTPSVFNPKLSSVGLADFSRPNYQTYQYENQTVWVRVGLAPTPWWQQGLTVGIDRYSYDLGQTQRRLTTSCPHSAHS